MSPRKSEAYDEAEGDAPAGLLPRAVQLMKTAILVPVQLLTSKLALKAYITSILFAITAFVLFGFAILAYLVFYYSYIPRIGFSREIHLQYDSIPPECRNSATQHTSSFTENAIFGLLGKSQDHNAGAQQISLSKRCSGTPAPWGTATIAPDAVTQQPYDVVVELSMPLSPLNTGAGVFMLDARLLSLPTSAADLDPFTNAFAPSSDGTSDTIIARPNILAHSRRPASLPFLPPIVSLSRTLLSLPLSVLNLRNSHETTFTTPLFTRINLPRRTKPSASNPSGATIPTTFHIQLLNPAGYQLQVHSATVHFRARFTGLRWAMYNIRVPTATIFVSLFFTAECFAAAAVYAVLSLIFLSGSSSSSSDSSVKPDNDSMKIKQEPHTAAFDGSAAAGDNTDTASAPPGMSDTERTFPTYGGHPLRYRNGNDNDTPRIKAEPGTSAEYSLDATRVPGLVSGNSAGQGREADDEDDEDADYVLEDTGRWRDSGLGTSMESGREGRSGLGVRRRRSRGGSGGGR